MTLSLSYVLWLIFVYSMMTSDALKCKFGVSTFGSITTTTCFEQGLVCAATVAEIDGKTVFTYGCIVQQACGRSTESGTVCCCSTDGCNTEYFGQECAELWKKSTRKPLTCATGTSISKSLTPKACTSQSAKCAAVVSKKDGRIEIRYGCSNEQMCWRSIPNYKVCCCSTVGCNNEGFANICASRF